MDVSELKSERTGTLKNISGTVFHCFEPKELPFDIKYSPELVNLISEASMSLGNLSEAGRRLPNPHLLITPCLKKEAVLSSKIEGTRTTLADVFIHEAEKKTPGNEDLNEVLNYVKALQFGLGKIKQEKISIELVKEMHKILLEGVRCENKSPGKFKEELNWIGSAYDLTEAKFVPCEPASVQRLMENLINYLNDYNRESPLLRIGIAHYQFETIHPFKDGNGRLGRLLIILYLCQKELIAQPLFYISAFFEKYREDYDNRLKKVSMEGDIEGWLKFFLTAVKTQANDAVLRVEQMEELREKYRTKLLEISMSTTVHQILEFLFENPVITIPETAKKLNCHYPKAKYNIEILIKAGILEEIPREKGEKLFTATEIRKVLEGV